MYHVISTVLAATLLYIISFIFYRLGFYSRSDHRKLWNWILASAFMITAFAGIFLALQINYKWNIPFIKTLLKWHVECGIGLAITGIFHSIWHFSYFIKKSELSEQDLNFPETITGSFRQNLINLFLIGFLSSSVQLLMMREIMNIAGGYELITGTFLASWLIGSAAGAAMARRSVMNDIKKVNLVFGLSPIISILLMIVLNRFFLKPGETPSFLISIIYTIIVLLPFSFVSGFAFIRILFFSKNANNLSSGRSFSIETIGGIAAGITVSVLTSGIINTYRLLLIIIMGFLCYVILTFFISGRRFTILTATLFGLVFLMLCIFDPDIFFRQQFLHKIKVRSSEDTPYGNITIGEYGGEQNKYYNSRLITWKNDEVEREENIHYAMLQHPNPQKVLLISGDVSSNLREIVKYPVKCAVFVERDPALIKTSDIQSNILRVENVDGYTFVRKTKEMFDVVLLIIPPPSTLLLNRYYTTDFFREIKNKLSENGVFVCSPGTGENYFNEESTILYSSVYNSLSIVFKNVVPIVGNKLYYLASDGELSSAICSLVVKRNINNIYVNQDFLSDDLIKMKSDEFISNIDRNENLNSIELPLACFHFQSYNLTKNVNERVPAILLLIIVFLIPLFTMKGRRMIMYTSASALAGFEIIMLLVLQSSVGNMYQLTGLIIAALMTGLAIGAGINLPGFRFKSPFIIAGALVGFYILSWLYLTKIFAMESSTMVICVLFLVTLVPSFFTGLLFKRLTEESGQPSYPAKIYSADLAGSALGFILITGLVIPAFGVRKTLIFLAAMILAGVLLGTLRNKS